MKNTILLSSLFIAITSSAFAQEKDSTSNNINNQLILMFGGGVGHLNPHLDANSGNFIHKHENVPTFNFEVVNDMKLGNKSHWRLRIGVDVVTFHQTMISPDKSGGSEPYFVKNKLNQSFLNIPIEVAYDWFVGGKSKALIRPHAGFGVSLLTSNISKTKVNPTASSDYPNAFGVTSDYVTEKYKDNKYNVGMMFKAGVTFAPIPSLPNLMFDLSYNQQFIRSGWVGRTKTMVNNNYDNTDHVHDYGYRNTSKLGNIAFMVGYHISFPNK